MMRLILVFALGILGVAEGTEPQAPPDPGTCIERNLPEPDNIRAVRVVARDRQGAERVTVARLYGRRTPKGLRQVHVRFVEPANLRDSAVLILEREGENEMYFKSSEFPETKRIRASGRSAGLFGGDLSYEDFELLEGFKQAGKLKRLEDEKIGEDSVYVVEIRPQDRETSSYERVLSYIDPQKCMALRMEMYEPGERLRKVVTVNPRQIVKRGPVWIASNAMIRDLRDETTTQFLIDSTEQDVRFREGMFSPEQFDRVVP
jgi:hypothetical protein